MYVVQLILLQNHIYCLYAIQNMKYCQVYYANFSITELILTKACSTVYVTWYLLMHVVLSGIHVLQPEQLLGAVE